MLERIDCNLNDLTYQFGPAGKFFERKANTYKNELSEKHGEGSLVSQALSGSPELVAGFLLSKGASLVVSIPEGIIHDFVVQPLQTVKFYSNDILRGLKSAVSSSKRG